MKMKMKRIMGFFLALVIFMGYLPLNPTASYANGNVEINDTNFEDEIFRNYVKDNFDKDKDNYLSQDELNKVKNIYIYGQSVSSLKGIEYFKNLTKLYCYENKLRSLDLRENTKLIELDCNKNKLTKLDISKNKNLTILNCISNKLTSLDVRENTKLIDLFCSYNKLTKLDISKNKNLTKFYCDHNKLTSLDISKNKNLTILRCDNNKLRSLNLRNNTNLTRLDCSENKLESLDISKNKNLTNLLCYNNNLTSLDLRNNTNLTKLYCYENNLTSLDVSKNTNIFVFYCRNQQYKITVIKGIREFKYSEFPGQFDKDKVTSQVGASFGTDALTVDSDDTNKVTYKYKVDDNREMDVTLNVTYFDPENVESMVVKEQPKKLSYTEGEKLDLSGLVVTLTDNQGLTKDVAFKDFETYKITTNPENGADLKLTDNDQPVTISKGSLQDETNALTVKELVKTGTDPNATTPNGYTRVIFDAGENNTIDGTNRYKVIDVLNGTAWDNAKVKEQIPLSATYKDNTKEFDKWSETVPTTGTVEVKTFTAEYKAKELVKTGTDPNATTPNGYTRVIFDAGEGNTIDGTNRYKVIDVLTGTAWDNAKVKEQIPASAKYQDNTKEFDKWSESVPTTGNVETKTFTAVYKNKDLVKTGTDPNAEIPDGYTRIIFDATVDGNIEGNRYKVIDVLTGTAWDNAKVKEQIPASATYKDNTKEFKEWDSNVPDTGEVEEQDFTAIYKVKELVKTGTDPNATTPNGYTRVIFDAGEGNTIDGTNRYKVIDVLNGTAWDNAKVKEQIPLSATYKDNTKEFDKWSETVPTTGTVEVKTFTAEYKAKELVKTGTDPNATTPNGYTRVTFDAGENNTIDGTNRYKVIDVLNGTAWDNAKVKEQIPASATYKDNTKEFDKWSETVPTTGTVEVKTFTAVYKNKDLVKTGTDPNAEIPDGYTRIIFDATVDGNIEGNRYKVIDVLNGTAWDNAKVKEQIPLSATYKDNTKEFKEWDSTVPNTGEVEEQDFTAVYKAVPAVVGPVDPTDPNGEKPADISKYWTVTFKSEDETKGTVDAKNTFYVLKTGNKTLADLAKDGPKVTAKAGFKFTGWEPALDANTTINKDMTVNAKFEKVTPTPTDPAVVGPVDPTDPNGGKPADTSKYWTVTFKSEDETKGTVDAKNTVYVLKTGNKTLADLAKDAPKVTAKAGFKFIGWEPALDANTTINKDMTVNAKFEKVTPTPTDPAVVGPVDPTDPNGGKPADTSKYWTVTFKSADETKGTVDAKNTVYVLKTGNKTLADLAKDAPKVTAKAGFKFTGWEPALDANTTINKDMTVNAKFEKVTPTPTDPAVVGPVDPTDPNGGKPADTSKYWTVTFKSEDETKGTVDAKNTVYVLKTGNKTLADITAPKATAKAGFKFTGWEPALDANTTINKDMTVNAKFEKVTPTPTDPAVVGSVDPTDPNGGKPADTSKYWTVTFKSADETKGTVAAKNTVYVLKTENKTLADITASKVTAKAGFKFTGWEPALDANTTINKDMTVKAKFEKVTPTPTDPAVVGPVDPTDPNGEKPADISKYWTVTFKSEDETKGTVDAKNTFYVLKTGNKTLADLAKDAPKVTAKAGFKFTGWEPALDANTTINKDMTVNAKFEKVAVTPAPQDPPVVGTEDPTQPGKKPQVANNKTLPKTANSMNIELYTFLMILSAGLLVVAFKRKKESQ